MRNKYKRYHRRMRTTAERRANQDCEYVRSRRRPNRLPNSWDDYGTRETRNWKDSRKTQHRGKSRGERHEIFFETLSWRKQWALEEYFKVHDIPHNVETIKRKVRRKHWFYTKKTKHYQKPKFVYKYEYHTNIHGEKTLMRVVSHQIGFEWVYLEVDLDKPKFRWYNYSERVGISIVWWSDKDIGIDFILRRIQE